ncbi:unnamed protein product [Ectocarpus sp. 6 AP-2014]
MPNDHMHSSVVQKVGLYALFGPPSRSSRHSTVCNYSVDTHSLLPPLYRLFTSNRLTNTPIATLPSASTQYTHTPVCSRALLTHAHSTVSFYPSHTTHNTQHRPICNKKYTHEGQDKPLLVVPCRPVPAKTTSGSTPRRPPPLAADDLTAVLSATATAPPRARNHPSAAAADEVSGERVRAVLAASGALLLGLPRKAILLPEDLVVKLGLELLLWSAVLNGAVWWGAVGCIAVRFGTVWFGAVRFGAVRFGAVRFGAVRFGAVRFGAVWCGTVWCGLVWRGCGVVCARAERVGGNGERERGEVGLACATVTVFVTEPKKKSSSSSSSSGRGTLQASPP